MIKVGIWGYGGIAAVHRRAYAVLEEAGVPVKLVSLCDIRPEQFTREIRINISDKNSKPLPKIEKCYTDIDEMMANEELDMIDICLPAYLHADAAIKALNMGYHVMSEKPMALNHKESERMLEAAASAKGEFMVGHCVRFNPYYAYLKNAVENGSYGKVVSASFQRLSSPPLWSWNNWYMDVKKSGGVKLDLHIHDIDAINYIFGMPDTISCIANSKEGLSGIDSVFTTMKFNNTIINIIGDWSFPSSFSFDASYRVSFEKGTLTYNSTDGLYFYDDEKRTKIDCQSNMHNIAYEIKYFVETIENSEKNIINPPLSSANTIKIEDAMTESLLHNGKIVKI